jgi:hypothetical protein
VGNGSVNGEAAGPGQLYPLPIVTSGTMGWGAGQSAKPLGFWAEEAPKRGGREGREQEAKRGSQDLCVCVCVCVCVPRGRRRDISDRAALSSCPCTGLFSSQAINVAAASKAG